MKDPMLDREFLKKLDKYPHKFIWAKIISLNFEEYPVEEITGRIVSGSINIDGTSAVRRTCSLSLVAQDVNINDYYWGLKTKFQVWIGVENHIDDNYPDIIWFKQGIYLISSFSCNLSVGNYTINIQGKDKMSLLNGDMGGVVPASWDFGKIDTTMPDGTVEQELYPIKDIILQSVHEYAQEPWQNIIVNDLDDYGIELLEYIGNVPLYYVIAHEGGDNDSREVENMTLDGDMNCWVRKDSWDTTERIRVVGEEWTSATLSTIEEIEPNLSYEKLIEQLDPGESSTGDSLNYLRAIVTFQDEDPNKFGLIDENNLYTIAKITKDNGLQVCGYRLCDIVYPYDLIASAGDTLTSILDKLVQMLGNFEYFFDLDGRFIFQKKKTYLDVSYNNIVNEHSISDEVYGTSSKFQSQYSYSFDKNYLISSIQNSPNFSNLKNDYSLWGTRGTGDSTVPIHLRYAIDHKPDYYKNYRGDIYISNRGSNKYSSVQNSKIVDWRELIFQMANDYRKHYRDDDFLIKIRDNNIVNGESLYPKGYTGYEKYYIDFEMNLSQGVVAYWRELYCPDAINVGGANIKRGRYVRNEAATADNDEPSWIFIANDDIADWRSDERYKKGDLVKYNENIYRSRISDNLTTPLAKDNQWVPDSGDFEYNSEGWNDNILNNPEILNFWFDFLDTTGELNKYAVCNVGQRTKAVNDDKIKAIYFRETPNVIFETDENKIDNGDWIKPGYAHINISTGLNDLFVMSSRGKNSLDVLQDFLYSYTYLVNAVNLTTIPIYYLTPNTLIELEDKESGAVGEYIIQKYSIQLGLASQMSISAVQTPKRLY